MVEGAGSDDYRLVKTMLYARPDLMHRILAVNAEAVAAYLNAQVAAGAQAVMVFDSWGGVLADGAFQAFSLAYTRSVLEQLDRSVPAIVFTKGGGPWLEAIAETGADVVGLDWTVNLRDARRRTGGRVALQGNLDPMVLFGGEAAVRAEARRVLDDFGSGPGHVFNLGHGIHQHTPPEAVAALVDEVHRHSQAQRAPSEAVVSARGK
jgi:uroporphyrinogen decarboxylase